MNSLKILLLLCFVGSVPLSQAESEPNNSATQANGIILGVEVQGQIGTISDQDWFALSVPQATTVNVAFNAPQDLPSPSWEYHIIRCVDQAGAVLMSFGAAEDKTFDIYLPTSGIFHFVVIKGKDALVTAPYGLLVSASSASAEREPNNSGLAATPLQHGITTFGQLNSNTDTDWFLFSAGSSGTATIQFDSPADLPSPSWEYHILTVSNESGVIYSTMATASDISFDVSLPAAGSYFIKVVKGKDVLLSDAYGLTLASVPMPITTTALTASIRVAVEVSWTSQATKNYTVQRSATLTGPSWQQIAGPFPGTGAAMRFFDSTSQGARNFYRVIEQ